MNVFILLLVVSALGLLIVIGILFNEQLARSALSKKFSELEEIHKRADSENKKVKAENRQLMAQVEELTKKNEQLSRALRQRTESGNAGPSGLNKIVEIIDWTKLGDIMSSKVISLRVESPFSEVARKMEEYDIRHLPIVDSHSKLVGIMTQRMLYQIKSPRKLVDGEWYYDDEMLNGVILKNVMEKEVISLHPDQSIGKALVKMAYSKCGCIPIVDHEGNLVGIVTRKDILKVAANVYEKNYDKK